MHYEQCCRIRSERQSSKRWDRVSLKENRYPPREIDATLSVLGGNQCRPVRGRSHPMITSCGVRRPRGRLCRWTAAFVKASACWPDCRFSRASAIHSRMTARRAFGLAIWIAFRGVGGGADRDLVEIDRLRSGEASVLSITPFLGLQAGRHARLLHGSISSGRDLISRALQPRFYMSRIRSAGSIAFAISCTLISAVGRHYSAFRKEQRGSHRIHTLSRSSSGQAFTERGAPRRTARRPDRAVDLLASSGAWRFCKFANEAFRATWRPRCRSIVHIWLGYTTDPSA